MKKFAIWISFLMIGTVNLCGCGKHMEQEAATEEKETIADTVPDEEIIILYTNDVHCAVDDAIGYAGVAAYKKACFEETPYVTLVDCGDAIQGGMLGTLSDGEAIVDIMNKVPYDLCIFGNHEFDYGMEQLKGLMDKSNALYLGCNLSYNGENENALSTMEPYTLIEYGNVTVGFVGVMTPSSMVSSSPAVFWDDSGKVVYDFCGANDGADLYEVVQENVDACLSGGADYVILLTHLGDTDAYSPYSSVDVAANTSGVDAILDGHAHHVIESEAVNNKDGDTVIVSSAGSKLNYIGKLVISKEGVLSTELVSDYEKKDTEISAFIGSLKDTYAGIAETVVAESDIALSCKDNNGNRLVRNRETAIGNLCADAYRYVSGADIAILNGGGIRADIPKGEITYADIISVFPFGDSLCIVEITGEELLDVLEMSCKDMEAAAFNDNGAVGESGGFLQVSGIKFVVDTSVPSSVQLDDKGMFTGVTGARRVKEVYILNAAGEYVELDREKTYSLASRGYILRESGDGYSMFADNTYILDEGEADTDVLISYLTSLDGQVAGEYCEVEGRIRVE